MLSRRTATFVEWPECRKLTTLHPEAIRRLPPSIDRTDVRTFVNQEEKANERTRTALLLITSVRCTCVLCSGLPFPSGLSPSDSIQYLSDAQRAPVFGESGEVDAGFLEGFFDGDFIGGFDIL